MKRRRCGISRWSRARPSTRSPPTRNRPRSRRSARCSRAGGRRVVRVRTTPLPVIASEAKQPCLDANQPAEEGPALAVEPELQDDPPRGGAGLLRCARNNGAARTRHLRAPRRAASRHCERSEANQPRRGPNRGRTPGTRGRAAVTGRQPRGGAGLLRFARNDGGRELATFALAPLALTYVAGLALGDETHARDADRDLPFVRCSSSKRSARAASIGLRKPAQSSRSA